MKKWFRREALRPWGLALALAGILLVLGAWLAEMPFASVAGRYQLVKESPEAALFGSGFEKIGTPQVYVVPDRSVVLPDEGEGPRISLNRLQELGAYPLQLVTVQAILEGMRLAAFSLVLAGGLAVAAGSRPPR